MSLENYGNYQLLKRLATGGMAQIYLARHKGPEASEQLVVVKRILPHLGENKEFVQMFLDEAKIAARLAHPNIVAVHDLGAQDDSFFIAMEYIHGEDVRRLCKRAGSQGLELPVPLACRIVIDACAGLDYAHKKTDPGGKPLNIVHRDVSPQNILVSFKGEVKVVDFGIAKAADQATVTRSGVLKGKYSYMSPEQAAGQRVDCRSDVFALGVVLYELLTSTRLFKRNNDMQTLAAVADCKVIPPSQANPRVPADLDPIVMKALAKEPDERYAEALQLQEDLEAWLRGRALPAGQEELTAFVRQVYQERLEREARTGSILVEEEPPSTVLRTAVEGNRRSGGNPPNAPSPSSREVTRAERGELMRMPPPEEESIEVTDPLVPQDTPRTAGRGGDARREPEADRRRQERPHSGPRPMPKEEGEDEENPDFAELPTQALDEQSLALSMTGTATGTTQAPRRHRVQSRLIAIGAATVSAVVVAFSLVYFLKPAAAPAPATARLETVPAGARGELEGKPLPGGTPVTQPPTEQPPSEGRAPEGTPVPQAPVPAAVQLTLRTEPVPGLIFVEGKERGLSPQVVEARAEQELEVRVTAPQYRPLEQRVKVRTGPSQVELLKLEPLSRTQAGPIKQTRADPPRPSQPDPAAPKAMVRFAVTPWAEVTCNGKSLGTTPFPDVAMPVGSYQCRFSNPDLGRTIKRDVEVKATPLNTVKVKF